jgi:hypothetical protein
MFLVRAYYAGIRIFKILPPSLGNIKNKKGQFKEALTRYLNLHSYSSFDEFMLMFENDSVSY